MSMEVVKDKRTEELTTHEPSIMEVLSRAAADPRCDVTKLQVLLDMQERVEKRAAEIEFNAALSRLMLKLPRIEKDGTILNKDKTSIRSRYATYEAIDLAIRPLLGEEGFSISFDTDDSVPKVLKVTGTLAHRMGHTRQSRFTVPTENPVIAGSQAVGAADSFAKRYIVINMLNLVTVGADTDGEQAKAISDEQAMTIETLLTDMKADRRKFLAWAGVQKIADILERDFATVVKTIQAKGRQA